MKRYEPFVDYNTREFFEMEETDSDDGWVPASVAQALYDALRRLTASHKDFMECTINPKLGTPDIEWSREIENQALAALSLADGEESTQ